MGAFRSLFPCGVGVLKRLICLEVPRMERRDALEDVEPAYDLGGGWTGEPRDGGETILVCASVEAGAGDPVRTVRPLGFWRRPVFLLQYLHSQLSRTSNGSVRSHAA